MSSLETTEEPKTDWRDEWAKAVAIKFKRPQYLKMLEIKKVLGCNTWAELADELHRIKELLARRHTVYKV